jgi:hypothetical protein
MSINNLELLKPLLTFKEEGDFYRIHILKRKKDQTTNKANHQSVRTIKNYSIYDLLYLEEKYQEIKDLCEHFKARAYISVQRLNDKNVALLMLKELVDKLQSNQQKMENLYDSTIGNMKSKEKRWIIDIDKDEVQFKNLIEFKINELAPAGNKILLEVPTKSGLHLITSPFRVDHFQTWTKDKKFNIDVQKCNPTCLFIPDSLINNN